MWREAVIRGREIGGPRTADARVNAALIDGLVAAHRSIVSETLTATIQNKI